MEDRSRMSTAARIGRYGFVIAAWLFAACSVVQIYLAGLGVFESPRSFITHRDFGYVFGILTLVMLVLAILGRLPRRMIGASVLLMLLFALQSVFIFLRTDAPLVAALHPVNGFLIAGIALMVAVRSRRLLDGRQADSAPAQRPEPAVNAAASE